MKRSVKVEAGQRFRSIGVTGRPTYAFEIAAIFRSAVDQRHYVRLVEIADPTHTKTVALVSLLNPRDYRPLAEDAEGSDTSKGDRQARGAALDSAR